MQNTSSVQIMAQNNISPPVFNKSHSTVDYPDLNVLDKEEQTEIERIAADFYTFFTPIILIVGLIGNGVSLCVFASKNMRGMSASRYLAALSVADIASLLFYVLTEWLREGLPNIYPEFVPEFLDTEGWCQLITYLGYVSRFMSVWLVVCFTIERLVVVCVPFRRRTLSGTTKVIVIVTLIACILVLYKPLVSDVRNVDYNSERKMCVSRLEYRYLAFILDSVYGGVISIVPFIIITICNILIVRVLILRRQMHRESWISDERNIWLEFTFIMLAISVFFIAFNMPYFVVWMRKIVQIYSFGFETREEVNKWTAVLQIVRTLFYLNFCVNFFLYSVTGKYFRRELKALFCCHLLRKKACRNNSCSSHYTHVNRSSWV